MYTYNLNYCAWTIRDRNIVVIPDQVAKNQTDYDGKSFPVLRNGHKVMAKLRGDAYGLHTSGTGDPVVAIC